MSFELLGLKTKKIDIKKNFINTQFFILEEKLFN